MEGVFVALAVAGVLVCGSTPHSLASFLYLERMLVFSTLPSDFCVLVWIHQLTDIE